MQPQYLTVTATGTTAVTAMAMIDTWENPIGIGFSLLFTGAANTSAQLRYTFEDVGGVYPNPTTSTLTWFSATDVTSTNVTGSINFPIAALQLRSSGGTGTVTAAIVQSGGDVLANAAAPPSPSSGYVPTYYILGF